MEPAEYEVMARVEADHWWYRALRDAIARTVAALDPPLPAKPRVLDAGCGTGANLALLAERLRPSYLGGFDASPAAVDLARRRVPAADVYASDLCAPELHADGLHLVLSADVVYIPGVERALPGLRAVVERMAPGGRLVLNLPAYRWLYSEHDAAIHTSERYTRADVARLLDRLGLAPERLTYRLAPLFPLVAAARLPRLRRFGSRDPGARSDLHAPPGPRLNEVLRRIACLENGPVARGARLPFGSSVFAVGRKG